LDKADDQDTTVDQVCNLNRPECNLSQLVMG
jgi:hypothetical protein